jgi:hypothetical protein
MAASAEKCDTPTVGLIAVTLPADSQPLRHVWIDQQTLLVGYDPDRLTHELVARLVREIHGVDVTITEGVTA